MLLQCRTAKIINVWLLFDIHLNELKRNQNIPHFGRLDYILDYGLNDDVPSCRHGHWMARRHTRSGFASRLELCDLREHYATVDGSVMSHFPVVDIPIRSVSVHQPLVYAKHTDVNTLYTKYVSEKIKIRYHLRIWLSHSTTMMVPSICTPSAHLRAKAIGKYTVNTYFGSNTFETSIKKLSPSGKLK